MCLNRNRDISYFFIMLLTRTNTTTLRYYKLFIASWSVLLICLLGLDLVLLVIEPTTF